MIDIKQLTRLLQELVSDVRDKTDGVYTPQSVVDAELLIAGQLVPMQMSDHKYLVGLSQPHIGAIAGFLAPTTSEIDTNAILLDDFDSLREVFPERAFWECVEEYGGEFYAGED